MDGARLVGQRHAGGYNTVRLVRGPVGLETRGQGRREATATGAGSPGQRGRRHNRSKGGQQVDQPRELTQANKLEVLFLLVQTSRHHLQVLRMQKPA